MTLVHNVSSINIVVVIIVNIIIFLTPVLNSQGMKKLRYAIQKKYKNQNIIIIIFLYPGSIDPRG